MKAIPPLLLLLLVIRPLNPSTAEAGPAPLADTLSSSRLVAAVLEANPRLEAVQAAWQASSARIAQQSAMADPELRYGIAPLTLAGRETDVGQQIEISQQIPWPGKLELRGKAAEFEAQAGNHKTEALRLALSGIAKTLFADWYFIHQAIAINKVNQALLTEFRNIARSRYSSGLAGKQDALRADMERNLLKHQHIVLERQRRTLLARINTLLNRTPDDPLPPPQRLAEISALPDLKALRLMALQSRPELKTATADIHAGETRTELAELDFYPDLKLSAGYNGLWDNTDKRFTLGVGINIPLDQSKRRAARQEALAKMKAARWRKIDLEAKILEQLQIAYDRAEESLHALALYRNRLFPLAEQTLAAAKADYEAGNGDFLALIDSEKNRMQTQLQNEQALADAHRSFVALEYAVGSLEPLAAASAGSERP